MDGNLERNSALIGIDIGGTGIKGAIVNPATGALLCEPIRIPTPRPATPDAVAAAVALIEEELSTFPGCPKAGSPLGVTFPGIIQHGIVRSAANVDKTWLETHIDALLTARLDRPVKVMNDADAAGLAEARYGAGEGVSGSVLVITLGTGIGSAFIFDGKLVPNAELGHLEIDGFDAETKASAVARERDRLSWADYGVKLQRYFSHLEFLFSPELFIVGGGISIRTDEYLPSLKLRTPIVPAVFRNEAGIVGAALHMSQMHNTAGYHRPRSMETPVRKAALR
ncbi:MULTISPECIES: polyphosphate--glucose phosphotransferase [unclassified Arthrobacter]|uniref:polyphosphate--glucose phosphotransferase n=1 Tax=unclassified Arthrobacter TaxID=235627 RepID=UPI001C846589|nr:ROK family protein [Arthrobacter sp. MAHUQ-56]MBX7445899.1 ROK family protein [Arthrobacter sp. MAHUQ-56]